MRIYSYSYREFLERLPIRQEESHKGSYGKLLIAAGSRNMCGAAYLAAKAAYRCGTGLVYVYTSECNRVILQQLIPEAVLITYEENSWSEDQLLEALSGKTAVAAGPGMGVTDIGYRVLKAVVECAVPKILDADALNLLAVHEELWESRRGQVIVTPHPMEMSRMTKRKTEELEADRSEAAAAFSRQHQVITVLKGHRTVVTDGREIYLNNTGNHGMATAGSGDVLTGAIGGFLAQGMEPFEAARVGVYAHGLAGDQVRDRRGARSMMAGEIAEQLLYGV